MNKHAKFLIILTALAALMLSGCGLLIPQDTGGGPSQTPMATPGAATQAAYGSPSSAIWITVFPSTASPGDQLTVLGQGFQPNEKVNLTLLGADGQAIVPSIATLQADGAGTLAATPLRTPPDLSPAQYALEAQGTDSQLTARAQFSVRGSGGFIETSRDTAKTGDRIWIVANGFQPAERVAIYFDGHGSDPLAAVTADAAGNVWTADVPIPALPTADYQLVALGQKSQLRFSKTFHLLGFQPMIMLGGTVMAPGATTSVFGYGFIPGEEVQFYLANRPEQTFSAKADAAGQWLAPNGLRLPDPPQDKYTVVARGNTSQLEARADFGISQYALRAQLGAAFGRPSAALKVIAQGFLASEKIDIYLGSPATGTKLASIRADGSGALTGSDSFTLPDTATGPQTISLMGEILSRGAIALNYYVQAWDAQALATPLIGAPGTAVSFSANGFAPGEQVLIYLSGQTAQPLATGKADAQGNFAQVGPFAIPSDASGRVDFRVVGSTSGISTSASFFAIK